MIAGAEKVDGIAARQNNRLVEMSECMVRGVLADVQGVVLGEKMEEGWSLKLNALDETGCRFLDIITRS